MPELPEVETARRLVDENCVGKKVVEVVCADDDIVIEKVKPEEFKSALEGRTLKAIHRKGKSLWFELDEKPWPTFHFGMTGSFVVKGVQSARYRRSLIGEGDEWPPKYLKVLIKMDDDVELAFCDARRLARVRLMQDPAREPPISNLGPDALLELPDAAQFAALVTKRRVAIKAVIMDQSVLSGVGNWVADEVLYAARLHPEAVAAQLTPEELERLRESIKLVLEKSVEVGADSEKFPDSWLFHHRWDSRKGKKEAPLLNGNPVEFITVGGRTSAFVPAVQGSGAAKASGRKGKGEDKPSRKRGKGASEAAEKEEVEAAKPAAKGAKKGKGKAAEEASPETPAVGKGKKAKPGAEAKSPAKRGRRRKVSAESEEEDEEEAEVEPPAKETSRGAKGAGRRGKGAAEKDGSRATKAEAAAPASKKPRKRRKT